MQRSCQAYWAFAGVVAIGLALPLVANAKPVQEIKPLPSVDLGSVSDQDRVMLQALQVERPMALAAPISRSPFLGARLIDPSGGPRERVDFGHIGGVALVSREVDQYGRVRGVNFLTFDDPKNHWNMKLNVKHGAMLQITRRWGGGPRPLSDHDFTSLAAQTR